MAHKIIAIVNANGNSNWFVLKNKPVLKYNKYGSDTIIGTDGTFFQFYGYERPSERWKAFAGREFDLKLEDGTVEHCYGQWWDKMTQTAINEFNINDKENKLVHIAIGTIDSLKKCYVFYGYSALKKKIDKLVKRYKGKVYEYWEYKKILKERK